MTDSVLILGAAGFIGRHLAEAIARTGTQVIAATRAPAKFVDSRIYNAVASFDEPRHYRALLNQAACIFHSASTSTPGSTAAQPQLDGNLRTTLSMIEALQEYPDRRLVYLSSGGSLYGECVHPASEDTPLRPRSYHGAGKAAAEHFIHAWANQYNGTAVILRPSNIYGPGQSERLGFGIIPAAFNCALKSLPLPIFDGTTMRDYLYIDDFISLCKRAAEAPLTRGTSVFNAASGLSVSLNALIDRIDAITGLPIARQYEPARQVDIHCVSADTTAARTMLLWSPVVSLEEGLRRTWQWFSTHA